MSQAASFSMPALYSLHSAGMSPVAAGCASVGCVSPVAGGVAGSAGFESVVFGADVSVVAGAALFSSFFQPARPSVVESANVVRSVVRVRMPQPCSSTARAAMILL